MNYFKKEIDFANDRAMFEFLKKHTTYFTLHSWNRTQSIANNVKVYNLGLEGDCYIALQLMRDDEYYYINSIIESWEREHQGYLVGANGRSDGYFVLYNKDNSQSVLPNFITDSRDYDDYVQYCKDYNDSVENNRDELVEYVKLVQDFDALCDEIRDYANELSKTDIVKDICSDLVEDFNFFNGDELESNNINYLEMVGKNGIRINNLASVENLMSEFLDNLNDKIKNYPISYTIEETSNNNQIVRLAKN